MKCRKSKKIQKCRPKAEDHYSIVPPPLLMSLCLHPPGAGVLGVPLWGPRGAAAGAGLQAHAAAAELPGAVGCLAGWGGLPGPKALPAQRRFSQGCQALPAQMVLLQVTARPRNPFEGVCVRGEQFIKILTISQDGEVQYQISQELQFCDKSKMCECKFTTPKWMK